jgi:hypothetical protein
MAMHIQLTMIIFFVNMMLTFLFPQYVFVSENIYQTDDFGDVSINDNFSNSITVGDSNLAVGSLGIVDAILLVWDFITYIFGNLLFALPVLIYSLPVIAQVKIAFFFPMLFIYVFALMGWVRRS